MKRPSGTAPKAHVIACRSASLKTQNSKLKTPHAHDIRHSAEGRSRRRRSASPAGRAFGARRLREFARRGEADRQRFDGLIALIDQHQRRARLAGEQAALDHRTDNDSLRPSRPPAAGEDRRAPAPIPRPACLPLFERRIGQPGRSHGDHPRAVRHHAPAGLRRRRRRSASPAGRPAVQPAADTFISNVSPTAPSRWPRLMPGRSRDRLAVSCSATKSVRRVRHPHRLREARHVRAWNSSRGGARRPVNHPPRFTRVDGRGACAQVLAVDIEHRNSSVAGLHVFLADDVPLDRAGAAPPGQPVLDEAGGRRCATGRADRVEQRHGSRTGRAETSVLGLRQRALNLRPPSYCCAGRPSSSPCFR